MTRPKITLTFTVLALAGILGTSALAAPPGAPGRGGRDVGRAYRAALARVGLTEEQKATISSIAEEARAQGKALRAQHQADRAQLRLLLTADDPEPAAIGTLVLKLEHDRTTRRAHRTATHQAMVAVLDHDQRIRFESYLDAFRSARQRGLRGRR